MNSLAIPDVEALDAPLVPDFDAAARFLALLDESADEFTFQTFDDSEAKRPGLARILHGSLSKHADALALLNAQGAGVFVMVNRGNGRGRTAGDVTEVRALFADTDGAPLAPVMACDPHFVVESSPDKYHAYWPVDGLPLDEFKASQQTIADLFGSDRSVCDLPRVTRLPGYMHRKGEPHRVRIIHESAALPCTPDRLRAVFASAIAAHVPPVASVAAVGPHTQPAAAYVSPLTVTELRSALNSIRADSRPTWIAVGASLRELGDVGRELWLTWSASSSKHEPKDALQWDTLAHDHAGYKGIFKMAQACGWTNPRSSAAEYPTQNPVHVAQSAPTNRPQWKLQPIGQLLTQPSPTEWLVRGILEKNSLACIFGAPGSGKSFIAVDLAACVAMGAPWHARAVKQGAVVYLAGEGHSGLRRRFLAWSIERAIDLADAPLLLSSAAIDLNAARDEMIAAVEACGVQPTLVVVDTLHRHLKPGADENSSTDMGELIAAADFVRQRFACAVVIVHHSGHGALDRERGSSALRGSLDWSYSVAKGDSGPVVFQCRKSKDHEIPDPTQFELHSVALPWLDEGEPETSAVLRVTGGKAEVAMGGNQLLAMSALRKLVYATRRSGNSIVLETEWRTASGLPRNRWAETRDRLVAMGSVRMAGGSVEIVGGEL